MAQLIATTTFSHTHAQGTSFTVPLSQAAGAGHTLVFLCAGGATATATGFTKRTTYGGGAEDVSISDITTVGGETSVSVTLNGAENVSGIVYELGAGLTFKAAANNGTGTNIAQSSDYQVAPAAVSVSGASLIVGLWSVGTTTAFSPSNQWRQLGPYGKLYANAANQPGSYTQFIWSSGIVDVDATHQYPKNLATGNYQATSTYFSGGTAFAAQAAYTDTSGVTTNPAPANPIVAENSLPGTHNSNWYLGTTGTNSTIAGYTDKTSYNPGDTVNFKVDSTSYPFHVEIYRLGFYGWDTLAARNVLGNQAGYIVGTATAQSTPVVDGTLGSTSCNWTTNATWTIPSNTPPGLYYVVFRRTDVTTNASSGHFVVKSTSSAGKTAVVIPDCTHQAYNVWGATTDNGPISTGTWTGRNFYQSGVDGSTSNFAHRAYAVSFDRPYSTQTTNPQTYIFDGEMGVISFMEAEGYNLTYFSDVDLDISPTCLNTTSMAVLLGHSEYWSTNIYDAWQNAITAGVNIFSSSSNVALWHTRFAATDTNRRTVICYKDSGTADVSAGWSGTGYDPVSYTGSWRDTRTNVGTVNNTDIRRENSLTGQLFITSGPTQTVLRVPYASKTVPIWRNASSVQALTTGQTYSSTTNVLGYELDSANGSSGQPANLVNVSPMSYSYTNGANAAGTIYNISGTSTVGFTLYRANSSSLVFHTGSWRGWWSTTRWQGNSPSGNTVDLNWQNAMLAILYDLGQIPGSLQAMEPGQDTTPTNPAIGAPTGGQNEVAIAYGLTVPVISGGFMSFFTE